MFSSVFLIWGHLSQTNLTEASSIAIWNKNRLVVGTAIIVWATNVSFIILGKLSSLPHITNVPESHTNVICIRYCAGE
jgi:hypothetical protein